MASGHVYRTERPNTWPHRPMLLSEDSSCQSRAVHTWPIATEIDVRFHVGERPQSGRVVLKLSFVVRDPMYGPAVRCKWISSSWR
jgi:hypothetical protein